MGIIENLIKLRLQAATVVHKSALSPSAIHLRLKSEKIKTADFVPGYFLRVGVGLDREELSFRDKLRSYTVWNIDKNEGTVDLAVVTHSKGIGAAWAEACKTGDQVFFTWHTCKFTVNDQADSYLMIGDLSALAHLYEIRRNLSTDKVIKSIFYSTDKSDFFEDIDGSTPFLFNEMPENPEKEIIEKIEKLLPQMEGNKMVYIGGDSRLCVSLTQYFRKELKWNSKQIKTKPFWNPNKKGLD